MTILKIAEPHDFEYIDYLRKAEGDALGFIPKDAYMSILGKRRVANRDRWKYSEITVTEDNGDLTGYCYYTFSGDWCKVVQIAVQHDARRWHRAMLMIDRIENVAIEKNKIGISCRVAFDLESNNFWLAMGYEPTKETISTFLNQKESKSKRKIIVYTKIIGGLFYGSV